MSTAVATKATEVKPFNITRKPATRATLARIKELKEAERAGAAAARERKALEADLRAEMGNAETIIVNGQTVAKLSSLRTTHLYDYDMLRETFPEAYEAVHSESHYKYLTVL